MAFLPSETYERETPTATIPPPPPPPLHPEHAPGPERTPPDTTGPRKTKASHLSRHFRFRVVLILNAAMGGSRRQKKTKTRGGKGEGSHASVTRWPDLSLFFPLEQEPCSCPLSTIDRFDATPTSVAVSCHHVRQHPPPPLLRHQTGASDRLSPTDPPPPPIRWEE